MHQVEQTLSVDHSEKIVVVDTSRAFSVEVAGPSLVDALSASETCRVSLRKQLPNHLIQRGRVDERRHVVIIDVSPPSAVPAWIGSMLSSAVAPALFAFAEIAQRRHG